MSNNNAYDSDSDNSFDVIDSNADLKSLSNSEVESEDDLDKSNHFCEQVATAINFISNADGPSTSSNEVVSTVKVIQEADALDQTTTMANLLPGPDALPTLSDEVVIGINTNQEVNLVNLQNQATIAVNSTLDVDAESTLPDQVAAESESLTLPVCSSLDVDEPSALLDQRAIAVNLNTECNTTQSDLAALVSSENLTLELSRYSLETIDEIKILFQEFLCSETNTDRYISVEEYNRCVKMFVANLGNITLTNSRQLPNADVVSVLLVAQIPYLLTNGQINNQLLLTCNTTAESSQMQTNTTPTCINLEDLPSYDEVQNSPNFTELVTSASVYSQALLGNTYDQRDLLVSDFNLHASQPQYQLSQPSVATIRPTIHSNDDIPAYSEAVTRAACTNNANRAFLYSTVEIPTFSEEVTRNECTQRTTGGAVASLVSDNQSSQLSVRTHRPTLYSTVEVPTFSEVVTRDECVQNTTGGAVASLVSDRLLRQPNQLSTAATRQTVISLATGVQSSTRESTTPVVMRTKGEVRAICLAELQERGYVLGYEDPVERPPGVRSCAMTVPVLNDLLRHFKNRVEDVIKFIDPDVVVNNTEQSVLCQTLRSNAAAFGGNTTVSLR